MEKNFDEWNRVKKRVECKTNFLEINEREIWWCSFGLNIGDEENGDLKSFERPVLIIKKFNNRFCVVLPLTTKNGNPRFYHQLEHDNNISFVILSQIKVISVKRLKRKISNIKFSKLKEIRKKLFEII